MTPKAYTIRHEGPDNFLTFYIPSDEFDGIVDGGYEVIVFVTHKGRYSATVDEWQDYGYYDVEPGQRDSDPDVDVIRMNKSYMGRG